MASQHVHFFELETDPSVDLMEDATLDALYEGGCDDALVGHHRLAFARRADTLEQAMMSAKADAESVSGVRVLCVKIDAADVQAAPQRSTGTRTLSRRARRSAAAV